MFQITRCAAQNSATTAAMPSNCHASSARYQQHACIARDLCGRTPHAATLLSKSSVSSSNAVSSAGITYTISSTLFRASFVGRRFMLLNPKICESQHRRDRVILPVAQLPGLGGVHSNACTQAEDAYDAATVQQQRQQQGQRGGTVQQQRQQQRQQGGTVQQQRQQQGQRGGTVQQQRQQQGQQGGTVQQQRQQQGQQAGTDISGAAANIMGIATVPQKERHLHTTRHPMQESYIQEDIDIIAATGEVIGTIHANGHITATVQGTAGAACDSCTAADNSTTNTSSTIGTASAVRNINNGMTEDPSGNIIDATMLTETMVKTAIKDGCLQVQSNSSGTSTTARNCSTSNKSMAGTRAGSHLLERTQDTGSTPEGNSSSSSSSSSSSQGVVGSSTPGISSASLRAVDAAASTTGQPSPSQGTAKREQQGLRLVPAALAITVGLAVKLLPSPAAVTAESWTVFAVFCTTVAGLILEPLPVGAWALCCLCSLLALGAVPFKTALAAAGSESIWFIVVAFFFARSFEESGLGQRVANIFVAALGSSALGLSYGLAFAEALVAPALPSATARAGGIFMPVIKQVAQSAGSAPDRGRQKLGAFLVHAHCQASSQSAALFMTGAAQNLLAMSIAAKMGIIIPDVWVTWFKGALVPSLVGLLTVPAMVYWLQPPETQQSPEAPKTASNRLREMGALSRNEIITLAVLLMTVTMWVFGEQLQLSAVAAAMIALSVLLAAGVVTWQGCLQYTPAWDTLIWFSVLMGMCAALTEGGVMAAFADAARVWMTSLNMHWTGAFAALHLIFFMGHYVFASQVGHVGALYGAFLAMMVAAGVPSTLAALSLGYNGSLLGTITHYASGPAAVYYASGYQSMGEVLRLGALLGLRSLLTWGVVGMAWWRVLGWW